jgi:hypothetical protein
MPQWFDSGKAIESEGYTRWIERHSSLVQRYARQAVERKYGSDLQLIARMHNQPEVAYNVLQDRYRYTNKQKMEMCLDELLTGSKIVVVVGDRGEGKSALAWALGHYATLPPYNRQVYTSYVDQVPPIAEKVDSPTDCPENGIYVMDEAHITGIHARRGSSNVALSILNQLSTLRHGNRTFFLITQDASFIDKNAKNLYNVVLFKKLPINASENMRRLVFDGYDIMLPHNPTYTYYQSRNYRFLVQFGLAPWWSDKWSASFGILSDPDLARQIIIQQHGAGIKPPAIKTYLECRGYKAELEEIKDIIVQHTEKVLQQIKDGPGERTITDKLLDDTAISAVDRLYGGECETIDEVYEAMQREGYSTVTQEWIRDQILTIKLKTAATQRPQGRQGGTS